MTADYILRKNLAEYIEQGKCSSQHRADAINDAMIEFAKLKVTEALKQASEKARVDSIYEGDNEFEEPQFSYKVDKNSILNSYDLNNIK